jgi:hypothetical protein
MTQADFRILADGKIAPFLLLAPVCRIVADKKMGLASCPRGKESDPRGQLFDDLIDTIPSLRLAIRQQYQYARVENLASTTAITAQKSRSLAFLGGKPVFKDRPSV